MSSAKKKLHQLAQVDAAPAPSADPLDRLAEKANAGAPDDIVEMKVRCSRAKMHTLDKLASLTRYRRNGLINLLLDIGMEELDARMKAGKGLS